MNKLQVIVHDNRRVLTTGQLAESYGTDNKNLNDNFQNNKEYFEEGKHFIELKGGDLKRFKASTNISGNLKYAPVLYLWTDKGALLHAKSLNTPQAWQAYEMLIDEYYNLLEENKSLSAIDQMLVMMKAIEETNKLNLENKKEIEFVKDEVLNLKDDMRVTSYQESQITNNGSCKVIHFMGGTQSNAYKDKSLRSKVYAELWGTFKRYFKINKKGDLQKIKFEEALEYIAIWEPSTALRLQIKALNSQMQMTI